MTSSKVYKCDSCSQEVVGEGHYFPSTFHWLEIRSNSGKVFNYDICNICFPIAVDQEPNGNLLKKLLDKLKR